MSKSRSKDTVRAKLARLGITPRGMALDEAAGYCDMSEKAFLAEVAAGRLPGPLPFGCERRIWDRHALDAALDKMAALAQAEDSGGAQSEEAADPYMAAINNA